MSFMGMTESPEGFDDDISDYEEAPVSSSSNKRPRRGGAANNAKTKGKASSSNNAGKKDNTEDGANDPASARKLQNRTAQREFRQRKLQYVKDLEARVEFLSSPKDEQLETLKALLYGFMEENKQLRTLSQNLAKFIGDGIGGLTAGIGFTSETLDKDFDDFVYRGDKDTLHRLYEAFRENQRTEIARANGGLGGSNQGESNLNVNPWSEKPERKSNSRSNSRRSSPAPKARGSAEAPKTDAKGKKPTPDNTGANVNRNSSPHQPQPQQQQQQTVPPAVKYDYSQAAPYQQNLPPVGQESYSTSFPASASAKSLSAFPFANVGSSTGSAVSFSGFLPPSTDNASNSYSQLYGGQDSTQVSSFGNSNNSSSGGFFFDTAAPSSMPTTAFTNNFISEYLKTGLTPSLGTTGAYGDLQNFDWGLPFNPDTPVSSTSSNSQNVQSGTGQYASHNGKPDPNAVQAFYREHASMAEARSKFNLPNGITPDEVISSNPLLSLIHLISHHMRNKAANPDYEMPETLQPTTLQVTTPHDFRIDGILSKALRDSLIINADKFDADEFYRDVMVHITVHPTSAQDALDNRRLEFAEPFFRKYKHILTPDILEAANSWRRSRGEPDIIY